MSVSTVRNPVRPVYSPQWLFHRPEFITSITQSAVRSFYQYSDERVLAVLRCLLQDGSAFAAPDDLYGCMELHAAADPLKFMEYVKDQLAEEGVTKLSLTLYPEEYDRESCLQQREVLEQSGFRKEGTITHRLITVTEEENEPLASRDWRENADHLTDFTVTQEPLGQFEKIDRLVRRSGIQEDNNGAEQLLPTCLSKFPEETVLFAVREGAKYCALGVFIQTGPGMLYTLHLSQLEEYAERLPLVSLLQFVYEWAELREMRYIDLGQVGMELYNQIGMGQGTGERWVRTW